MWQFLRTRSLAQLAGIAMVVAGVLAFVYQATKNAVVASRYSEGWMAYVDDAGGAAVELFVAAAAIGIISLSHRGKVQSRRALAGLMALCVVFGIFAASQQINVGRAVKSADTNINQTNLAGRSTDLARDRAELATMAGVPSVATATSALDKLKTRKGWAETSGCATPGGYRVFCRQVADANAVIGRAQAKERLEARIAAAQTANERTKGTAIAAADPMATLIAGKLGSTEAEAQLMIAVFSAVTMMLLGMFGVHFGLLVYGMEHDTAPQHTAEVVPLRPANDSVARETKPEPLPSVLTVGKAIIPARAA